MSDESSAEPTADESAEGTGGAGRGFDIDQIAQLGGLMDRFDLSEVRLRRSTDSAEEQWTLRRGAQVVAGAAPVMSAPAAMPAAAAAPPATASGSEAGGGEAGEGGSGKFITAPTLGTFYGRPSPDDPPFVKPGDAVSPETVVCLLEAMKVYNKIEAETSGTIARVLVADGDPVEFGQKLFELK